MKRIVILGVGDISRKSNMRTQNRRVSIRSSARTDPIRQSPRNLSLLITYRTMPHTQATTMDTKAQFCSSHGYATEAFHSTHYTRRQNEVGGGLTYQQF